MPTIQGKIPKIQVPGKMVGIDENGQYTNNSVEYRGRPYTVVSAIEQAAVDYQREVWKPSFQKGQRAIGVVLTTGTITPPN